MSTNAAIWVRVSTDGKHEDNQTPELEAAARYRDALRVCTRQRGGKMSVCRATAHRVGTRFRKPPT